MRCPRTKRAQLACSVALALGGWGLAGAPALAGVVAGLDDALPPTAELTAGPQTLYLDLVMDEQLVRPLVRFVRDDGRFLVSPVDLDAVGLMLPDGLQPDADGLVELEAIPGLSTRYEPSMQRMVLMPLPSMRRAAQLGYRTPQAVSVSRDQGVVLDWDAYGRRFDDFDTLSLGTALRWFGRAGTLQLAGVSRTGDGDDEAYLRLDTRWTYSDPQRMWSWSVGDTISGGLTWTRPVRLGGVQWRRNFATRPDLVVFPLPAFTADATVPSSVDVFVNNVRQYSGEVDPGPFVVSDFPRLVGAGQAMVVVTDALGRTTQTSVPLYVDYQRLAKGLSDFSLEAGLLRSRYGIVSDDYGQHPVASGSWRRGLSDNFTGELHAEVGERLSQGGIGMAWSPLGRYGVITANYAHSSNHTSGHQYGGGYQWFGQRVGFDFFRQRATAGFRDLGSLEEGGLPLREQDRASMWVTVPGGSVSLSWLRYRDHELPRSRTIGLGLSQTWRRVSASVSAFDDDRSGHGVSLMLNVPLGEDYNASASVDRSGGDTSAVVSLRRDTPYAGGWGWALQARDNGDAQAAANLRGRAGDLVVGVDRMDEEYGAFAQGNGSFVFMDGQGFVSRAVSDSFAVVSTNGVADVPILFENRVAGRTNGDGYLLLADLRGWQRNRVAIDPDGLSADMEVPAIEQLVTPADRAGVRVPFALRQVRSSTVVLRDGKGALVEAGTRVQRADGSQAIVGFDGELWLEHYVDGETLRWRRAGVDCELTLPVAHSGARSDAPAPACLETKS